MPATVFSALLVSGSTTVYEGKYDFIHELRAQEGGRGSLKARRGVSPE